MSPVHVSVGTAAIDVRVEKRSLGTTRNTYDDVINTVSNRYSIPPHMLKAQVEKESGFTLTAFRYEPLTIDFYKLTGDGSLPIFDSQGKRWISRSPYQKYLLGGSGDTGYLSESDSSASCTFTTIMNAPNTACPGIVSVRPDQTTFELGTEVLARTGRTVDKRGHTSAVKFTFSGTDRNLTTEVFPYDTRTANSVVTKGRVPTTGNEFSIDYSSGKITLGTGLGNDVSLTVTYNVLQSRTISDGPFTTMDLAKKSTKYPRNQTIAQYFEANLKSKGTGFFGTDSERSLELRQSDDGTFSRLVDNRFYHTTAQYYAAASYGPIQMTLQRYEDKDQRVPFDEVLNADGRSLSDLTSDWNLGLSIGGVFHRDSMKSLQQDGYLPTPICNPCNTELWEERWSQIIERFNSAGPEYIVDWLPKARKKGDPPPPLPSYFKNDMFKNNIVRRSRVYKPL